MEQLSDGLYLGRLLERVGPPVTLAGPPRGAAETPSDFKELRAGPDEEVLGRIRHVLKAGEQLMEFHARTGLGRAQILSMSKAEITKFVEASERDPDPVAERFKTVRRRQEPPRPRIIDAWSAV